MNGIPLARVGYWSRSPLDSDLPWPVEAIWDPAVKRLVVSHLESGATLKRWRGLSLCRVCGERNGSTCLTDRVYQWPQGLAHYVSEHDVELPEDFVDHVLAKSERT